MLNQLGFYKYIRKYILDKRVKYPQTAHTYIQESMILRHHIIVPLQFQDKKLQNELYFELFC